MVMRSAVLVGVLVLIAIFAGTASAAQGGTTVDGSLIFASEPASGFGSTVGIGFGVLADLPKNAPARDVKLGIRGDLAYFDWSEEYFGVGVSYTRLMFFGGPRFTFLTGGKSGIAPYLEGGFELSFDHSEVFVPGLGKASRSDTSLGLAGGGGIDFPLSPKVKLGVNARLHLIDDSFMTVGMTLGMMF